MADDQNNLDIPEAGKITLYLEEINIPHTGG